ncbi:hypothetical protein E2C01_096310 [Portunus trituberculatus]|uniref:Uncharacterized protein n=1 Tax=Portunus trituberculatus TaxID=210409 RepID=A0A5B7JVA1_PORTR|nr:hypothetical protein [Portunus trituberculatus]
MAVLKWCRGYNKGDMSKVLSSSQGGSRNNGLKLEKLRFRREM